MMQVWFDIWSVLSVIVLVAVALPFVHNSFWVFRVCEYPRFQKLLLCVFLLMTGLAQGLWQHPFSLCVLVGLAGATGYLFYKIFPYTGLGQSEMKKAVAGGGPSLRLFSGNVLQYNTNYAGFVHLIKKVDPDLVLLLETDSGWEEGLKELEQLYPYTEKSALDNTYGMLFYSRLPVKHSQIRFLAEEGVPSLDAVVELPNGQPVQLWGLHPKPPLPSENPRSVAKDKELMKVALEARDCALPIIVLGDLNDVAWSYTTELFRKTSQLLDPRRGRGFYSTFSAKHWWLKFPLDYVFASTHFTLRSMRRLPPTGSDHYPICIDLQFCPAATQVQEAPEADAAELQKAKETARQPVPE